MNIYWNPNTKKVYIEMTWEDARDWGYELLLNDDKMGHDLVKAAQKGAGFQ